MERAKELAVARDRFLYLRRLKTFWQYISYFFYNAINWSLWLALFVLYHDIRGAFKYGIHTFSPVDLKNLTIPKGDTSKASRYEAVNFFLLEKLLENFRKLSLTTSIVDLGCGKGRVLVVAAHYGFIDITGIDFALELCQEAERNMEKVKSKFPQIQWNIVNSSVEEYDIMPRDSVFFMFNPFTEEIIRIFLIKLEKSCQKHPRTTYFLYASPQYKELLTNNGYEIIFQKRIMHLQGIIARKNNLSE
jgi:SAM-dependent methyltransferase